MNVSSGSAFLSGAGAAASSQGQEKACPPASSWELQETPPRASPRGEEPPGAALRTLTMLR